MTNSADGTPPGSIPGSSRGGSDPIRVLHVEEDRSFRTFLAEHLEEASGRLSVVPEGDVGVGLSRLRDGGIDCVVSDFAMEGTDGLEFLAAVREDHGDLPFVMLTASGSESVASDATSLGVTFYLVKGSEPAGYATLADLIVRTVDSRRARATLETTQRKYRSLVEAAPDAIFLADAESGEVLEANPAAATLLGRPTAEIVGRPHTTLHPEGGERQYRELFSGGVATGGSVVSWFPDGTPIEVQRADGERIPVEINASVLELDDRTLVQAIFRDVSGRRERERALGLQNERLEEFADVVAHDLRNPLNVASLAAELLPDDAEGVEELVAALDRIETIVEDVLALAKQGRFVDDPVRVDLARVASLAWAMADTEDAVLEIEASGAIEADLDRLQTLLENLFRNSVEHSSTGRRMRSDDSVEHSSTGSQNAPCSDDSVAPPSNDGRPDEDGGTATRVRVGDLPDGFFVEDDGPGIPEADRGRIFQAGVTSTVGGTGLGLAIVRRIAEAHGWEVAVEDGRDGGARFTFTGVVRPAGPESVDGRTSPGSGDGSAHDER